MSFLSRSDSDGTFPFELLVFLFEDGQSDKYQTNANPIQQPTNQSISDKYDDDNDNAKKGEVERVQSVH